jgi:hypothetical protein
MVTMALASRAVELFEKKALHLASVVTGSL